MFLSSPWHYFNLAEHCIIYLCVCLSVCVFGCIYVCCSRKLHCSVYGFIYFHIKLFHFISIFHWMLHANKTYLICSVQKQCFGLFRRSYALSHCFSFLCIPFVSSLFFHIVFGRYLLPGNIFPSCYDASWKVSPMG